ncbi:MAG: DUF3788 family protein [Bryobacterales bacterium]|nr:DUF3788 family protein [Bryobacterales bacterium]
MLANAFIGHAEAPSEAELLHTLGARAVKTWNQIIEHLLAQGTVDRQEWNSYSIKYGWALRLKHKKRNILYLSPNARAFTASFIFGQRAVAAALAEPLPEEVLAAVREGKRYPEGTGVYFEVRNAATARAVETLAAIKAAH